jgi:hypothetical protein
MKCPECATEMSAGTTKVTWSTLGYIAAVAAGGVQQYLYFYPADGGESDCVFEGTRKAFRCPKCRAVVIAGPGGA